MNQNNINLLVTTGSGIFGGLTKAYTSGMILAEITFTRIGEVALYAAISALVGYAVKLGIDRIKNRNNPQA